MMMLMLLLLLMMIPIPFNEFSNKCWGINGWFPISFDTCSFSLTLLLPPCLLLSLVVLHLHMYTPSCCLEPMLQGTFFWGGPFFWASFFCYIESAGCWSRGCRSWCLMPRSHWRGLDPNFWWDVHMGGNPKIGGKPPKWMVKMENPIFVWMIWEENPLFLETPIFVQFLIPTVDGLNSYCLVPKDPLAFGWFFR